MINKKPRPHWVVFWGDREKSVAGGNYPLLGGTRVNEANHYFWAGSIIGSAHCLFCVWKHQLYGVHNNAITL